YVKLQDIVKVVTDIAYITDVAPVFHVLTHFQEKRGRTCCNIQKPEVNSSHIYVVRAIVCAPSKSALDKIVLILLHIGVGDENDPTVSVVYHNLDYVFDNPLEIDVKWCGWEYRLKKMEKRVKKMKRFTGVICQLHKELGVLADLETRKDKCLAAIGERPAEVTDDSKWDEMDGNAIANLHLALADGVLSSIEEKKNAKEIWDHLARLYEARSLHNKFFLKRKLYVIRMTESTSMTEHVNNLNTLFSQLTSLSFFDDVAATILEEENRRNNREDRQTSSRQVEALVVTRGRSMEPGSSESHNHGKSKIGKKKNFKCFKCGKPGHFRKDCRGLNTSYPQGNVASTSDDGNALCCKAGNANESRKRFVDVWLFDTGATFHMTARREWFHQYKPIFGGGSVYSCNDHELKIIGIGSIMVKMHDGTVRTIRDVRHVEGMMVRFVLYAVFNSF
ncbi:gag-pol polyprotein, partial [Tanacetum coccineum]